MGRVCPSFQVFLKDEETDRQALRDVVCGLRRCLHQACGQGQERACASRRDRQHLTEMPGLRDSVREERKVGGEECGPRS